MQKQNNMKIQMPFLIFTLFLIASCITITRRPIDDGYVNANKEELNAYADFSMNDSNNTSDSFKIVEINSSELKEVVSKSENALIVIWTTWCGHCLIEMPHLIEQAKKRSIIFVNPGYDINNMKKIFSNSQFNKPVYVISASVYGNIETDKTRDFLKEITNDADSAVYYPKHLYFKQGVFAGNIPGKLDTSKLDDIFDK
jgi:thiol-disulfide isomerase/thioredoxin